MFPFVNSSENSLNAAQWISVPLNFRINLADEDNNLTSNNRLQVRESVNQWLLDHDCDTNSKRYPQHDALYTACNNDSEEILKQLIEDEIDVNSRGCNGNTVMISVCESCRIDDETSQRMVKVLLKFKADLHAKNVFNFSAFYSACRNGKIKVAKLLIDHGVDVNYKNRDGESALNCASIGGHIDILDLLLENNVSFEIGAMDFNEYFKCACRNGLIDKVLPCLDRGIDCNMDDGEVFYEACGNGHFEVIQLLISHGLNLEEYVDGGIRRAIYDGRKEIVTLLLNSGVNLSDVEVIFQTATKSGYVFVMDKLIQFDNNIDVELLFYNNIFHACSSWQSESVRWLIDHGADVNVLRYPTKMNPLMYACTCFDADIAKQLIKNGIDLNAVDENGLTALMHACDHGSYDIVKVLVENGVDIEAKDNFGATALIHACTESTISNFRPRLDNPGFDDVYDCYSTEEEKKYAGKLKIVELLLDLGAKIESQKHDGRTAIFYAMSCLENRGIVHKLIDAGANLEHKDKQGHTVLSLAIMTGASLCYIRDFMNTGRFTINGRLKPEYRFSLNHFESNVECLKETMALGIFEWGLCQNLDIREFEIVVRSAMRYGICPGKINGNNSLLSYALKENDMELGNLIVGGLYFYPEDYKDLCSGVDVKSLEPTVDFIYNLKHNPMSLFKWTFINVSKSISLGGSPSQRKEIVDKLPLPQSMKNRLMWRVYFTS